MVGIARHDRFDQARPPRPGAAWRTACRAPNNPTAACPSPLPPRAARCRRARDRYRATRQHRIGIGAVERRRARHRAWPNSACQRRDQRALGRGRLGRQRAARCGDRLQREGIGVGGDRRIDVGSVRQRFAPPAHRACRIELLRLTERGDRGGMVEAVGEADPLVEIALGQRVGGGDREVDLAEPVVERDRGRRLAAGRRARPAPACRHRRRHGRGRCTGWPFGSRDRAEPAAPAL